jgi:hypothetical protein
MDRASRTLGSSALMIGASLSAAPLFLIIAWAVPAMADPPAEVAPKDFIRPPVTSPYAFRNFPDRVFFGDMHIHSNLSPDAGLLGTSLTAADVFRAARGETVMSNTGQPFRLVRPLDFLVLTDHAEAMGLSPMLREANPVLLSSRFGRELWQAFNTGPEEAQAGFKQFVDYATGGKDPFADIDMAGSIWPEFVKTADSYNQPGVFTAMTGFEWTSTPDGNNLHRIVVFADGADKTSQVRPFTLFDSQDPAKLWDYMETYQKQTGGRVFANVHNGNLSNGMAFTGATFDGTPMDAAYAARRSKWEPLMEITQVKGDGETHPYLSPDDEFADFERWDVGNVTGSAAKTPKMLRYEYARSALLVGLEVEAAVGVNPYDFGFNGTTDSHTGLASSGEENFFGKFAGTEPGPDRFDKAVIPSTDTKNRIVSAQESASGLTGVWARENTRGEIFDAMLRKEIYATTGTRMRVRLFAGWDFKPGDELVPDFAGLGYTRGVPMGGRLTAPPKGAAPSFLVRAQRDPDWANLDRVQIIKGWIDADGKSKERIYDVAVSGGRKIGPDGRARTRWARRSTSRRRASPIPSVPLSWQRIGATRTSIRASALSTTSACSRSPRRAGPPTTPSASACRCRRRCRRSCRTALIPRRSGTRPASEERVPRTVTEPRDRGCRSPIWYGPRMTKDGDEGGAGNAACLACPVHAKG